VVTTFLAERDAAVQAGYLIGLFGIPLAGLVMLIIGLRQRSRSRVQPGPYPPGYPPPPPGMLGGSRYPYQPGPQPQQPQMPYPPVPYQGYPPAFPPRRPGDSRGTALIAIGTVLLVWGLLGILGRLASAGSTSSGHTSSQLSPPAAGGLEAGQHLGEFNCRVVLLNA
jgi:hypothetical protein